MSQEITNKHNLNLWQKLAAISNAIGHIEKTGKNQHFNYAFMEHAQVVATLRPIMDEYGVTVDFEAMDATFMDTGKSFRVLLHMKYIVTNADKPSEQFERLWVSEAMDQQDKGINKALTAAEKNVFAKLFHLSDKDLEDDSNDAAQPAARKAPTQATSRPVTPSAPQTVNHTSPAPNQPQAAKPAQAVVPAPRPVTQNGSTSAPVATLEKPNCPEHGTGNLKIRMVTGENGPQRMMVCLEMFCSYMVAV